MPGLDHPDTDRERWARVDRYFAGLLAPPDAALHGALERNAAAGLPPHDVSVLQGRFLALLVAVTGARRVLEIGTLGAYSTIHMAKALPPGGHIVTLEAEPRHAAVARRNVAAAGVAKLVTMIEGRALDRLPTLEGPFDLVFIDADKPGNPAYLEAALSLSRPGTVIVADNVVRGGAVTDAASADASVRGVRRFAEMVAAEPRLEATAVQTVGEKGWDGFLLARVR